MIFKCKMCGGDISPIEGTNTGKCEYCKSIMTLPNLDNEKIVNLYNRANDFRLSNDFDKAYGIYETILELDNKQLEAHWGLLLCKYGVEYVDDPKSGKKVPTCHRTIPVSILKDKEFEIIKKGSYGDALKLYQDEASKIADIQKRILEISSKEEPYDIFICYKESDDKGERTKDSVIAQDIYDKLIEKGYKVFFARITLEDKLGVEYEPYIYSALTTSKIMLVVGTKEKHFNATWVKNEWSRYIEMMKVDKNKSLIPVYSKIDAYKIPEEFAMYQAQSMDKVGAMQDLLRGIDKLLESSKKNKNDDFTYEMYEKFKQMKEEEEKELKTLKQVDKVYEKTNLKYKVFTFILSLIQAILIFLIALNEGSNYFAVDYYSYLTLGQLIRHLPDVCNVILLSCFVTFVSYFVANFGRLGNKISKALYLLNVLLMTFVYLKMNSMDMNITPLFALFTVINVILLAIKPKWQLAQKVVYVTHEVKNQILEKNKKIRSNFIEKEKYPMYLKILLIVGVVFFSISIISNSMVEMRPMQIKIINDYINIREETYNDSTKLGIVEKNEVYEVLEKEDTYRGVWYKIKTKDGIEGYIYSGDYYEYIMILD